MRKAYQSDLSDAEWGCLEPHLPAPPKPTAVLAPPQPTPDHRRHPLPLKERLPLAASYPRLPSMEERLPLLQSLASERALGEDALRSARAGEGALQRNPQPSATIVDSQSLRSRLS
jgi:hypothetical protein